MQVIPANEYYLLQVKILKDGQWFEYRNETGNIVVFINDFDAINYSKSEQFAKLCPYAIETRLVKQTVLMHNAGIGLQ